MISRFLVTAFGMSWCREDVAGQFVRYEDHAARIFELEAEINRLEKLVYVPGLWRCAKCEFQLIQANLTVGDGKVTARNDPGDRCPNCNAPLWRVTEREAGNRLIDLLDAKSVMPPNG